MLRRLTSNFAAQIASLAATFAERIVLVGIVVRAWGTPVYADWVLLLAATGMLAMAELGLGIYFGNSWQNADATGDKQRFHRLVGLSLYCYGIVALLMTAGIAGFILLGHGMEKITYHSLAPQTSVATFALLSAAQITTIMRGSISQIYRGRGQFARGTLFAVVAQVSYVAVASVLVLVGATVPVVASIYLGSSIAIGILMLLDLRRLYPDIVFRPIRPTGGEFREILAFAKWNLILMAMPVAILNGPVLLLGAIGVGSAGLAGFALMRTMSNYMRTLSSMLSLSTTVEIVPLLHRGENERAIKLLLISGRTISAFSGAICAALLLLGRDLVGRWSGQADLFDTGLMFCLAAGAVLSAIAAPIFSLFMLSNQPRPAAISGLFQLVAVLILTVLLSPLQGTLGAATGLLGGELIASCLILPLAARRAFGIKPWHYLGLCLLIATVAGLWSGMVIVTLRALLTSATPFAFLAEWTAFALFALFPALWWSVPEGQRRHLFRIFIDRANLYLGRGASR
ncbi:hypothetical protein [Rhizorhabdus sp.]|uniref:lipopolysaccharide biosynthesis protein n=1 Tax=Rhizorhabdus sp. TaxID=1968843 RepID=UPI00199E0621|nr:hypothetical protein [Rhizorhabdus sp.]MBD3760734.1 hypothetical protein [Rhizorhabdus sp.]